MALKGSLNPIKGLANKMAEHATRLAGALAFFDDPDTQEICGSNMAAGIKLASYYGSEALRLFQAGVTDPDLVQARNLSDWLQARHAGQIVPLTVIYQTGPVSLREAKTARRIMGILSDHNHVRPLEGGKTIDGKRVKEAWEVLNL